MPFLIFGNQGGNGGTGKKRETSKTRVRGSRVLKLKNTEARTVGVC